MIAHGVPGLDLKHEYDFAATPEAVFTALTEGLDAWWPAAARVLEPPGRMSLSALLNGVLMETGYQGGAILARVDRIEPGRRLYLVGSMGVPGVVMGRVHFDLTPTDDGCRLILTHQAIGPVSEDRVSLQRALWREALGLALRQHLAGTPV